MSVARPPRPVTVAEDDSGIVACLGRRGEEMGHFYTRPDRIGQGFGTQLLEGAKASGVRHAGLRDALRMRAPPSAPIGTRQCPDRCRSQERE